MRIDEAKLRETIRRLLIEVQLAIIQPQVLRVPGRKGRLFSLLDPNMYRDFIKDLKAGGDTQSTAYGQKFEELCINVLNGAGFNLSDLNSEGNMPFVDVMETNPNGEIILYSIKFSRTIGVGELSGVRYNLIEESMQKAPGTDKTFYRVGVIKGDYDIPLYKEYANLGVLPINVGVYQPNDAKKNTTPYYGLIDNRLAFLIKSDKYDAKRATFLANALFGKGNWALNEGGAKYNCTEPPLGPCNIWKLASGKKAKPIDRAITTAKTFNENIMFESAKPKPTEFQVLLSNETDKNKYNNERRIIEGNPKANIPGRDLERLDAKQLYLTAIKNQATSPGQGIPTSKRVTGVLQAYSELVGSNITLSSFTSQAPAGGLDMSQTYAQWLLEQAGGNNQMLQLLEDQWIYIHRLHEDYVTLDKFEELRKDKDLDIWNRIKTYRQSKGYIWKRAGQNSQWHLMFGATGVNVKSGNSYSMEYNNPNINLVYPKRGKPNFSADWQFKDYKEALVKLNDAIVDALKTYIVQAVDRIPWNKSIAGPNFSTNQASRELIRLVETKIYLLDRYTALLKEDVAGVSPTNIMEIVRTISATKIEIGKKFDQVFAGNLADPDVQDARNIYTLEERFDIGANNLNIDLSDSGIEMINDPITYDDAVEDIDIQSIINPAIDNQQQNQGEKNEEEFHLTPEDIEFLNNNEVQLPESEPTDDIESVEMLAAVMSLYASIADFYDQVFALAAIDFPAALSFLKDDVNESKQSEAKLYESIIRKLLAASKKRR